MGEGKKRGWGTPSLKFMLRQVSIERLVVMQLLCARALRSCGLLSSENAFGRTLQECNLWVKWLKLGPTGLFYRKFTVARRTQPQSSKSPSCQDGDLLLGQGDSPTKAHFPAFD